MTLWFLRGLQSGVVTTAYPTKPEPSTTALPTPPIFRSDRLTQGLVDELVEVCPSRALKREGRTLLYDVGACTACGRCLPRAGSAARPSGHIELAATSRQHLVKKIPILKEDR